MVLSSPEILAVELVVVRDMVVKELQIRATLVKFRYKAGFHVIVMLFEYIDIEVICRRRLYVALEACPRTMVETPVPLGKLLVSLIQSSSNVKMLFPNSIWVNVVLCIVCVAVVRKTAIQFEIKLSSRFL
jgi:hypothetical protein